MGCKGSKSKKNAYARVAQYQKESWAAERNLEIYPEALDWVSPPSGCTTPSCLHNLLTDGFYAPFAANPRYLLLVDCRSEKAFLSSRLLTARWYQNLDNSPSPDKCFSIVLYDDVPRTTPPSIHDQDPLSSLFHRLKRQRLDPKVVVGGWPTIQIICKHLIISGDTTPNPKDHSLPWYPTLLIPGFLYLGQADMAANPAILTQLRVTHVVALSDIVPRRVLPSTNYLVVPLDEEDPVSDETPNSSDTKGPDLVSSMPTVLAFVTEAKAFGGSVLVYCEQGFTRAAVVVMAILMADKKCSLEDAFYYVKGARSAVHPHYNLLRQLEAYETSLYGSSITAIDELF